MLQFESPSSSGHVPMAAGRHASAASTRSSAHLPSLSLNLEDIGQRYPDLTTSERDMLVTIRKRKLELMVEINQLKEELSEVNGEIETTDTEEGVKLKQLQMGKKKFNMDPKKGIEFLVRQSVIVHTPEDVAQFLYKGEGLNKTMIGDYLGERNDFNEAVLKAFVELHDFTDLILVQALRQFLWSFRLPGEAQKIDRMMESFAQRYCQLNPEIFNNTDTCYVLSFAIIMLNTSLHNPSVKDKPSVDQFISMNRGINDGGDLPRELLVSLYDSIKTEPFKIPEDDGNDLMHTFFNPDREGWLWKQGGRYKSWKRRWFILNDYCLYYFEFTTDKEPRGIIPLENIRIRDVPDRNKQHCFELYSAGNEVIKACKTDSEGKVVEGKHTVYRMSASTAEEKEEWINCIEQSQNLGGAKRKLPSGAFCWQLLLLSNPIASLFKSCSPSGTSSACKGCGGGGEHGGGGGDSGCYRLVKQRSISHNPFYDMLAARKKKAQKHSTKA